MFLISIILKMPTIFMILFLLVCLSCLLNIANAQAQPRNNGTIIRPGSTLSPTNTTTSYWVSNSGQFAFGFYPNGNGFSVGIWFESIESKTVVWTANRDDPPYPADAKLLLGTDGRLVVQLKQGQPDTVIASATSAASSASMLDSGNFVLFGSSSKIIWQSFDYPTSTIVASQRLMAGQRLVSDASEANHASGKFQLVMQRDDGNLVLYPTELAIMETGYWGSRTEGAGQNVTLNLDGNGQLYLLNSSGFNVRTLADSVGVSDQQIYRATIDADGIFRLYSHSLNQTAGNWSIQWSSSSNRCDPKGVCGVNSYCTLMNWEPLCLCLPGFDYIDRAHNDLGCNRSYSTVDACKANTSVQTNFNFSELLDLSWLDNSYSSLSSTSKDDCREECLKDCNCEAAIYDNQGCKKLRLPLKFGTKELLSSEAITFIKVDAAPTVAVGGKRKQRKLRMDLLITSIALGCMIVASLVAVLAIIVLKHKFRVRGYKQSLIEGSNGFAEHVNLRWFSFEELKDASNNFTNEIGKGACGTVFKGILANGNRTVAIKRLEKVLAEGEREFKNEMSIIANTHHRNLVKLLGYCQEGTNMLLVYEYMSNGSLADFFFKAKLKTDWEGRMEIALDIARGILYLHEECETQIIHCDIKPENILMDDKGYAKIADFGLAKLLMPNQTKTFTGIRGTRGYVAPEWWHQNTPITVKADVYSFGIMFLEIICCRRSVDMNASEDEVVLPYWVYDCFLAGEVGKVVKDIEEQVEMKMLERMVKVGLWCIQDDPSLRPSMKKVILMLEGTVDIPPPPLRPTSFTTSPYIVIGSGSSA